MFIIHTLNTDSCSEYWIKIVMQQFYSLLQITDRQIYSVTDDVEEDTMDPMDEADDSVSARLSTSAVGVPDLVEDSAPPAVWSTVTMRQLVSPLLLLPASSSGLPQSRLGCWAIGFCPTITSFGSSAVLGRGAVVPLPSAAPYAPCSHAAPPALWSPRLPRSPPC